MAGGTHHAYYDFGSGYCIFNDLAICALRALQSPLIKRILILDLDVHQGDGTAAILGHLEAITTCSIHGSKNFPFRKQTSSLDIGLPDGAGDTAYLNALEIALQHLPLNEFDLLLYQAGVDALEDDRLGRLSVSRKGLDRRNRWVFEEATIDALADLFSAAADFAY